MKRIILLTAAIGILITNVFSLFAQEIQQKEVKFHNSYYDNRRAEHEGGQMEKGAVVFFGNSITERGEWGVLFKHNNIANRGIGGDNTYGMLDRLPNILKFMPSKIFIMGGINDLSVGHSVKSTAENIDKMVVMIKQNAPSCKIYIQSALPVNDDKLAYDYIKGRNPQIEELNLCLRQICAAQRVTYVDLAPLMKESSGQLKAEYTEDGIHLQPKAYLEWSAYLKKKRHLK